MTDYIQCVDIGIRGSYTSVLVPDRKVRIIELPVHWCLKKWNPTVNTNKLLPKTLANDLPLGTDGYEDQLAFFQPKLGHLCQSPMTATNNHAHSSSKDSAANSTYGPTLSPCARGVTIKQKMIEVCYNRPTVTFPPFRATPVKLSPFPHPHLTKAIPVCKLNTLAMGSQANQHTL